jgi:23S rRNA (cytidine1920-2'-O)/16S rRNA (cytidine1409-2'-O)-methyltransferase
VTSRPSGSKVRADELLVQQGHADSRSRARALILAGEVRLGDRVIQKAGELLDAASPLELRDKLPYVSRGGLKLAHALDVFELEVAGTVAADLGASTGGFTDCLLQRGAARVYAVDVGYGQLDYRLRSDDRVVVMERVNARYLERLPEEIDLVTIDVSFISLEHILPVAARLLRTGGDVVALIKPQFEAGKDAVGRGGVVREEGTRRATVARVLDLATGVGLAPQGLTRSPLTGPAGNVEFLAWFRKDATCVEPEHLLAPVFAAQEE